LLGSEEVPLYLFPGGVDLEHDSHFGELLLGELGTYDTIKVRF
jgi:hypothetical protein